jgi:hypothetical protein
MSEPERMIYTIEFCTYEKSEAESAYEFLEEFMATGGFSGVLSQSSEPEAECAKCCGICGRALNQPGRPDTLDCGGDCRRCMAEAGDPDCAAAGRATTAAIELLTLIDVPPVGPQLELAERCFREYGERVVDAAYAHYAKDHKDLVKVMYEEREAKVAEARREGEIAMRERALAAIFKIRDTDGRSLDWCNALNEAQTAIAALPDNT